MVRFGREVTIGAALILLFVLIVLIAAIFAFPVGANVCYLNGQVIHGNLTIDAVHASQNFTVRFACP